MPEVRRAIVRIGTNYGRLVVTLVLGLYLVRVLLATLGDEGLGLFLLLTSIIGVAMLVEEVASWCMIRELGTAHHDADPAAFKLIYNSAVVVSALAALAMIPIHAAFFVALPFFDMDAELLPAARWFVVAKACEAVVLVALAPQVNMFIVLERMAAHNFWLVARRATVVVAAVALYWLNPSGNPAQGIVLLGWLSSGLMTAVVLTSALIIILEDRRLVPRPRSATRAGIRGVLAISAWSAGIQASRLLIVPLAAVVMNIFFGLLGNLAFGLAVQLAGYARMLASGMTMGLDAVAARISTVGADASMRRLVEASTRLHAVVAFPAMLAIGVLAEPLLELWVGRRVADPAALTIAAALTRILVVGFGILCLSDNWTRILYGAGHVRRYAGVVIAGSVAAPVLALALVWAMPSSVAYLGVAIAFSLAYLVFHLGLLPGLVGRLLGMSYGEVLSPLWRPLAAAALCAPALLGFLVGVTHWNLLWLGLAALGYACAYALACWGFVFTPDDRRRLVQALRRPPVRPSGAANRLTDVSTAGIEASRSGIL